MRTASSSRRSPVSMHVVRQVIDLTGVDQGLVRLLGQRARRRAVHRVDGEHEQRVADHRLQVLLGVQLPVHEAPRHVRPGRDQQVEEAVPLVAPAGGGDLREGQPVQLGELRARHQPHAMPFAAVDEPPVAVALGAQARPDLRILETSKPCVEAVPPGPRAGGSLPSARCPGHRDRVRQDIDPVRVAPARSCRPHAPMRRRRRPCWPGRSGARPGHDARQQRRSP